MMTLEQKLRSYVLGLASFIPDNGEAHLLNGRRRYLGQHRSELTQEQLKSLWVADKMAIVAAQRAAKTRSWEQDSMNDLVAYLEQEQQLEHREAA